MSSLYENNIIISREGKNTGRNTESKEENEFMKNLTEEVRKLHFQIQQRDKVINKLKQSLEKQKAKNGDALENSMNASMVSDADMFMNQADLELEGSKEQEI